MRLSIVGIVYLTILTSLHVSRDFRNMRSFSIKDLSLDLKTNIDVLVLLLGDSWGELLCFRLMHVKPIRPLLLDRKSEHVRGRSEAAANPIAEVRGLRLRPTRSTSGPRP